MIRTVLLLNSDVLCWQFHTGITDSYKAQQHREEEQLYLSALLWHFHWAVPKTLNKLCQIHGQSSSAVITFTQMSAHTHSQMFILITDKGSYNYIFVFKSLIHHLVARRLLKVPNQKSQTLITLVHQQNPVVHHLNQ